MGPTCDQPRRRPRPPQSGPALSRGHDRPRRPDRSRPTGSARPAPSALFAAWPFGTGERIGATLEERQRTGTASEAPIQRCDAHPRHRHLATTWHGLPGMFSDTEDRVRLRRLWASRTHGRTQLDQPPKLQSGVAARALGAGSLRRGAEPRPDPRDCSHPLQTVQRAEDGRPLLQPGAQPLFHVEQGSASTRSPASAGYRPLD